MKRFLSGVIAISLLAGAIPVMAQSGNIKIAKTNYVVGTTGRIEGGTDFSSSNESVASVEVDGTITAIAPGTAIITVDGQEIPVTVHKKGGIDTENVPAMDVAEGKYEILMGGGDNYAPQGTGAGIFALRGANWIGTASDINDILSSGETVDNFTGFIYKVDGALEDITAHFRTYDDGELQKRVEVAYMVGNQEFIGKDSIQYTLESNPLTGYGLDGCIIKDPWAYTNGKPMLLNTDIWTKVDIDWAGDSNWFEGDSETSLKCISDTIPSDASYILVLLHQGLLADGTAPMDATRIRFRGIELNYKDSIVAGEVNSDNNVAITFNKDVTNPEINVKKNNIDITKTASINYDKDSYTAYIDGNFASGDSISVKFGAETWTGKIPGQTTVTDFDSFYFKTSKLNYTEGGTGKIDLVAVKGDEEYIDVADTTYTSDSACVTVDNNGNLNAVSAGTANITPNVDGVDYAPITINVFNSLKYVESFIADDIANGLLDFDLNYSKRSELTSTQRNGTKLWAYGHDSNGEAVTYDGYLFHGTPSDTEYFGFVYKLESQVDSVKVDEFWYGDINRAKARTQIGYLTDDTVKFVGQDGVEYTWDDPNLCWWGANYGVRTIEDGKVRMNDMWTPVALNDADWDINDAAKTASVTTKDTIPADAKYMIVFLNGGVLADGSPAVDAQHMRYKGVTINYKPMFIATEVNTDNEIAMTLNADIENVKMVVAINDVDTKVCKVYDKANKTYYLSGFNAGDNVIVHTSLGEYGFVIPDRREQITSVDLTSGATDGALDVGATEIKADVSVENCKELSVIFFGALYGENGNLKNVVSTDVDTDISGKATGTVTLDGIEVEAGDSFKVFCWKKAITPIANVNNIITEFETEDF